MDIGTYLFFDGNAAEAAAFYADCLGGTVGFQMTFGDMPDQDMVTPDNKDRLAHANIDFDGGQLMVSDTSGAEPFRGHAGFSVQIGFDTADAARAAFDALSRGGEVDMPFAATFWSEGFGLVRDRFGVSWMINGPDKAD